MEFSVSLLLASVLLIGVVVQWLSWWAKLPAILGLLIVGIVLGPVSGYLHPDELLGPLLFDFVSLGVAVVLFEGALTLRFREIRVHGPVVRNLVTWGAVASWLIMGVGVGAFTGLSWSMSMLFAALVVVTGPTVIVPLLRTVRPNQTISNILRWEGILIDPLGALFAVFVFELVVFDGQAHSFMVLAQELLIGAGAGIFGALVVAHSLRRHLVPEYLQNFFVLAMVLFVFALSNFLGEEAGLVAVTLMGVWLGNSRGVDIEELLSFKENLSVIIISCLFILLAARIDFQDMAALGAYAVPVLLVVLLSRPIVIWICSIRSDLSFKEKTLLSFVAPRGIVAAAISSLFAIKLIELDIEGAELLAPLTFLVILVTVLLQSLFARPLARLLGVSEEDPKGVLIIGANVFARTLAKTLGEAGFRARLASMTWSDVQSARLTGLDCFFGNPVSVQADQRLDLVGIGQLVALSKRPDLNTLSCLKYRNEFGRNRVYSLRNAEEKDERRSERLTHEFRAIRLFGKEITLEQLNTWMSEGAEMKITKLSENFDFEQYLAHYQDRAIPLLTISDRGRLHWVVSNQVLNVKPNWTLVALVLAEDSGRDEISSLGDLIKYGEFKPLAPAD